MSVRGRVAGPVVSAVVVVSALAGCGSASHPDERSSTTASINTVIQQLTSAGDISSSSPVAVGSCLDHRAAEAWQAKLTARTLQLEASERSFEVSSVFVAHIGLRFNTARSVRQADSYETFVADDKTGTVLIFTVPGGEYVRIDGSIVC